jgi:flagellar L-ring protein FlgH
MKKTAFILIGVLGLSACGTFDRIKRIGKAPKMTPIENPANVYGRKPVVMPMPAVVRENNGNNSLWRSGARTFFNDQRAQQIGDILTVSINIEDKAKIQNTTERKRTSGEDSDLTNFFGLEKFPGNVDPSSVTSFGSNSSNKGEGSVDRSENVNLTVAAVVTQVLPNGNLVIAGRQEVRINSEVRELLVSGVVRPEDIASDNVIEHTQIAEARISYGGRGTLSDVQNPRYGQELYDILFPF